MKILVCGSRTWLSRIAVEAVLDGLLRRYGSLVIIEGCNPKGADRFAHEYTRDLVEHEHYPADWGTHGRAAGPIRNQQMLDEGHLELVVAFSEQPRTPGTNDMVSRAKGTGVPCWVLGHA